MNVLVTGGAGFIGSHFIRTLLDHHPSYTIINLDAFTYAGRHENLAAFASNQNVTTIKGDITDLELVKKILKEHAIHTIVNFAAETHVDNSIQSAQPFLHSNVLGVHALLEAARTASIQKFLHISTDEVYGSIRDGIFTEQSPLRPRSPYSASKAAADHLAQSYYETYHLPVMITRSSNNFGPNQFPEKFIPLAITNLVQGKKIPVYGNGKNIRDWLYVVDNCEAIDAVLHTGKIGEVYNISSRNERENISIARAITIAFSTGDEAIEFVPDRLGHDFRYALSHDKITNELGWKPRFTFDDALHRTISWYKENRWWWKELTKN